MSSDKTHDRLRQQADALTDPHDQALLRRLADLQELDERRRATPPGSAERDTLDATIAERAHRILHDDGGPEPSEGATSEEASPGSRAPRS